MNLAELYQWVEQVRQIFWELGHWHLMGLALYSYGVVASRHCAAGRVAEALSGVGKAASVQKRLERVLDNERINWRRCCRVWSAFVLRHYVGERIILLVDETKLGANLSVMVVGLACAGWCIALAFWAYKGDAWPMGQVALIEELLCWVAEGVPDGVKPLLQADRGIGTSPALIRVVQALGWHYLFRVQGQTRFEGPDGSQVALQDLVSPGGQRGALSKKQVGCLPLPTCTGSSPTKAPGACSPTARPLPPASMPSVPGKKPPSATSRAMVGSGRLPTSLPLLTPISSCWS